MGTAAIVNHQFTTRDISKSQTMAPIPTPKDVDKDLSKDFKNVNITPKLGESEKADNDVAATSLNSSMPLGCSLCHITYSKLDLLMTGKMKKCAVCK